MPEQTSTKSASLFNPRSALLQGLVLSKIFIVLAISALFRQNELRFAMAAMAALAFVGFLGLLPIVTDRRVQLRLNARGLTYRPFSPDPVPWGEVRAVSIVRTTHQLGRALSLLWQDTITKESINFEVFNPNRFARGHLLYRLSARLSNLGAPPTFPIEISFLQDVDASKLVREIEHYWKGTVQAIAIDGRV